VVLREAFPQGKGFIERMNEYLETSFLPLRTFTGTGDLQALVSLRPSPTVGISAAVDRQHPNEVLRVVSGLVADPRVHVAHLRSRTSAEHVHGLLHGERSAHK
jgi:hypothetical protein